MMRFYSVISFLLFIFSLHAQTGLSVSTKFGEAKPDELLMKALPLDTTADAAYLFDDGESFFDFESSPEEPQLVFHRHFRIKIYNKNGYSQAQIEIPLLYTSSKTEQLRELKAVTYSLESGKVVATPLNSRMVYYEDYSDRIKIAKFSMPNVQEGSILEVDYEVLSPFLYHYHDWSFQHDIPVIYSRYQAHMVPFFTYKFVLQGANSIEKSDSYVTDYATTYNGVVFRDKVYRWTLENIAGLKKEPFMPEAENLLLKMDFQILSVNYPDGRKTHYGTTWPVLCKELLQQKEFGGFLKKSVVHARKNMPEFQADQTQQARAEAIYNKVVSEFRWNSLFSKYAYSSCSEFIKSKIGSTAEINLYLTGMLKAAGLEAYPAILSTRDHGKILVEYPFAIYFNDVVAALRINNKTILLDATSPLSGFGGLPFNCINDKALIIKSEKSFEWLTLSVPSVSHKKYELDLRKDESSDSLNITLLHTANGYNSTFERELLGRSPESYKEFLPKEIRLISPVKIENAGNPDKDLQLFITGKIPCDKSGNVMVINPFCSLSCEEAGFISEQRQYPVDFIYKRGLRFVSTVHIPAGYEIGKMPAAISADKNDIILKADFERKGDQIVCSLMCEFKKDFYEVEKYAAINEAAVTLNQILGMQLIFTRN